MLTLVLLHGFDGSFGLSHVNNSIVSKQTRLLRLSIGPVDGKMTGSFSWCEVVLGYFRMTNGSPDPRVWTADSLWEKAGSARASELARLGLKLGTLACVPAVSTWPRSDWPNCWTPSRSPNQRSLCFTLLPEDISFGCGRV